MKIVHTSSGKAYHLFPETQLEIERPNMFFNEYGEQSLPIDLPDTDVNRGLMGYPDMSANRKKPQSDIACTIQDGSYYMNARQAVLGAKRKEKITTAFYMNEGSFLSRIEKTSVASIFGNEVIPGIETVQQGIDWCWSLRNNQDPNFAIFPAMVDLDGEKRGVNIVSLMNNQGTPRAPVLSGSLPLGYTYQLFNAYDRKENVNGQIINLSPGYYITPFIRANYLLNRIFQFFGYTLQPNFFNQTEPFNKMVFVNNTTDSLVNGSILLAHLVPDCLCSTILEIFRKKFCCEFVPNEVERTVHIEFFKDILNAKAEDITPCLTGYPDISYQSPQQLKLSSTESLTEGNTFDSTTEIEEKYPSAYYDIGNGRYKRDGYGLKEIVESVSDGNLPYYAASSGFEDYEVSVPDCQFCLSTTAYYKNAERSGVSELRVTAPYLGAGRTLNSTIKGFSAPAEESDTEDPILGTSHNQSPILAFVKNGKYYSSGTNHEDAYGYSLLYNGPIGIYEKFYRDFDNLLRNSLHKVTVPLLLTDKIKQSLPVHSKVVLNNVEYLIDILKYTIGGTNVPMDTMLLTTQLFEPTSFSPDEAQRMPQEKTYKWVLNIEKTSLTEAQWIAAGYEKGAIVSYPVIYPPAPTKSQYDAGGKHFERTVYYSFKSEYSETVVYNRYYTYLSAALI